MNIKRFSGILFIAFMVVLPKTYDIECSCPKTFVEDGLKLIDEFRNCLINTIDQLYPHLTYWKNQHALMTSSASQQEDTAEHINALEEEIDRNAHFLGYLNDISSQCSNTSNQEELPEKAYKTAKLMDSCLTFCPQHMQEEFTASAHEETLQTILMSIKNKMEYYTQTALERTKLHHKPEHFARHWLGYTFGTLCTLGAIAYAYNNKEDLVTLIGNTHRAAKYFFSNYAYEPVKNAINIFFGKNQPESIKLAEEKIGNMLKDYYQDNHRDMSPETVKRQIQDAIKSRKLPSELAEEFTREMRSIRTNLWIPNNRFTQYYGNRGEFPRIFVIEFYIDKLRTIDDMLQLLKAASSLAFIYCSYKISKAISHKITPQQIFYKSIKRALLKIEQILNNHNNASTYINYSSQGQLYYWLYKLRADADQVPDKKRSNFLEDLKELEASDLQVNQKLSVINRMYRTYSFLLSSRSKH